MRSPLALSPTTGERIKKRGLLNGFLLVKVTSNCQLKVPDLEAGHSFCLGVRGDLNWLADMEV
jgi:hypothetical protein